MIDLKLDMPDFKTEAEEAAWWPTQEDKISDAFVEAKKNGTLKIKRASEKARAPVFTASVHLIPSDVELAKKQAEEKGVEYQAYLEAVVHEALHRAG